MYSFSGIARPRSQFLHSCVCERFIYCQDRSTYFPAAEYSDRSWKYINLSQIYQYRNWETEIIILFEITVSFLGIHKWESVPNLRPQTVNREHSILFLWTGVGKFFMFFSSWTASSLLSQRECSKNLPITYMTLLAVNF
jgi:hypothetical protein